MKPYSVDLRERVLAALEKGMSRSELVTTFQVSLASLKRWIAQRRENGNLAPLIPTGGPTPHITSALDEALRVKVAAFPDATVAEHTQRWTANQKMHLSPSTLGRAIRRLNLTRKKDPHSQRARRVGAHSFCPTATRRRPR